MWDTNKASRQEACTTYIGHQLPLEYGQVPCLGLPLTWNLKARAKLAGLVSTVLQMGIQPGKWRTRKNDTGESVFPETDPFSLFSDLLLYLLLHIETNGNFKVTKGSAVLTFIKIRCFIQMYTKKVLGVLHRLLASGPANIL